VEGVKDRLVFRLSLISAQLCFLDGKVDKGVVRVSLEQKSHFNKRDSYYKKVTKLHSRSPIGLWHVTVTFLTGRMAGQTEQLDQMFHTDGTLASVVTSGPVPGLEGKGIWQQTGDDRFTYEFEEQIIRNEHFAGIVHVTNQMRFTYDGNTFEGDAQGTMTAPDGTVLTLSTGTVTATRAQQDGRQQS